MKKRLLMALICLVMLCGASALAQETGESVSMQIYNCDSWVSLREEPASSSERLAKVPLGALVTDCRPTASRFIECTYNGIRGYIQPDYLRAVSADEAAFSYEELASFGRNILDAERGGYRVIAQSYYGDIEVIRLSCFDHEMNALWSYTTTAEDPMQLSQVEAFVGGTEEKPLVLVYNASYSGGKKQETPWGDELMQLPRAVPDTLTALDLATGEVVWSLSREETGLDSGLVYAVADDGMMYLGGYFGPDPICISPEGEVLMKCEAGQDDVFWLYEIEVCSGGILAKYESGSNGEMSRDNRYEVFYPVRGDVLDPVWPLDEEHTNLSTVFYYYNSGSPTAHSCAGPIYAGFDVSVREEKVYAVADGEVVMSEYRTTDGFGEMIKIRHTVYDEAGGERYIYSLYAHLANRNDENGAQIKVGDQVRQGQQIGLSGNTSATRPNMAYHLHFELYESDFDDVLKANRSGNVWHVYRDFTELKYPETSLLANRPFASDGYAQELTAFLSEQCEKSGSYYTVRDDVNPEETSFIDGLYLSSERMKPAEDGIVYASRIVNVIE